MQPQVYFTDDSLDAGGPPSPTMFNSFGAVQSPKGKKASI